MKSIGEYIDKNYKSPDQREIKNILRKREIENIKTKWTDIFYNFNEYYENQS